MKGAKTMAATFTGQYEFSYVTPTTDPDTGQPINVPTTFTLAGISDDAARGIRFGLRKVTSITNVVVARIMADRDPVTLDPI